MKHILDIEVKLNHVSKRVQEIELVSDLNCKFKAGSVNVLASKNTFVGKSLLSLIAGLEEPSSGSLTSCWVQDGSRIYDCDEKPFFVSDKSRYFIPYRTQHASALFTKLYKDWDQEYFIRILKWLNVPLNELYSDSSEENRYKTILAIALASNSKIIVIDTFESMLKPFEWVMLWGELERKSRMGAVIIVGATEKKTWMSFNATIKDIDAEKSKDSLSGSFDHEAEIPGEITKVTQVAPTATAVEHEKLAA